VNKTNRDFFEAYGITKNNNHPTYLQIIDEVYNGNNNNNILRGFYCSMNHAHLKKFSK